MKKVKMDNTKVVGMVMETMKRNGVFNVKSKKIDSAIKNYLVEREEMLLDDEDVSVNSDYGFNEETNLAFGDMVSGVNDMIDDLSIVQVKESGIPIGDVSLSEDYLEDIITDLESVVGRLEVLKGL